MSIYDIPDPPPEWLVYVFSMPSGRYHLLDAQGNSVFPLPAYGALDDGALESNDQAHQAPGSRGATRTGFGTHKPLSLDFGVNAASLDNVLMWELEADAVAWERAFKAAARVAVKVRDTVSGEEFDGWITKAMVSRYKFSNWRKLSFTWQALDSHGWSPIIQEVAAGSMCPNDTPEYAFPLIVLMATDPTVTVSDGVRTLTVHTTAGNRVVVDSGRADGLVSDNSGLANYSGRFPRIAPGGSTLAVTGATGTVYYRLPLSSTLVVSTPTTGGGTTTPGTGTGTGTTSISISWQQDSNGNIIISGANKT